MLLRGECKHPEPVRRVINTSYVSDCDSGNESVTSLPLDKLISSQTVNEAKPELSVSVSEKKAVSSAEYPVMDTDTHPITAAAHSTDASGSSSSDVSPLGKVEPYQLKEKWLQQWLAQAMCNNPAGEISKPTTMSSSDVELPSPSASPEAGYKLHTSTASISVIPQTLLLYSYDNEIMHNIKHQLDERSSHVDQTNSNTTSPHTSTQLLKDKVFESKFVVRNFGNHAVDIQLKASCDAIQIVRMSTTKMKRDAFAFETSINPHCDICVYIEYTTNIHAMQTQLEGLLDPQTDLNALHKKPNSSTAMVQSSVGLMNNYRNSHVGYILLTATSIPDSSATNEPCVNVSSDFVIEVKYHHQYLYQLKLMRQGTRHSSGNKLKGAKQSVHRTIKSVDADVKVAAETAKNVETVESTDIRKSVEIPLSELLSSRKPQKANKTVQKVGDAKDKYTVSTQSTQNAATPTAHDPAKGLVYFKDESIVFDAVACGSVGRKTIDMCNNTDGDIIITFDRPQLPFGILHSIIRLHAKSYVQIPVLYTPQPEDATSHEVSLMGTITDVRSREHFDILKCKISIKLCGSSKT